MHFLSLETSTKDFGLALSKDAKVLRYRNLPHAKLLEDSILPSIDKLLDAAGIGMDRLDAFAVGLGPGSFTSLRVGLSTVKALAMALKKPLVGVCSLDVLAEAVRDQECDEICVLVDARRGQVYSALYSNQDGVMKRKGEYRLGPLADILNELHGRTLFVGDGALLYKKQVQAAYKGHARTCKAIFAKEEFAHPDPRHLAKLAFGRLAAKDYDDLSRLQPVYLYADNCQVDPNARPT